MCVCLYVYFTATSTSASSVQISDKLFDNWKIKNIVVLAWGEMKNLRYVYHWIGMVFETI